MNDTLARWNTLRLDRAAEEILPCCGSRAWAQAMAAARPLPDASALFAACDQIWNNLPESDWREAFRSHPRIGECKTPAAASAQSGAWSKTEQHHVASAGDQVKAALAKGNRAYEQKFGRIFIVCATGKSAQDILTVLEHRLQNDDQTELLEAAEQQRQITQIRLKKWLNL